jgi:hypothetical protein
MKHRSETLEHGILYTVRLSVIRDRTDKISLPVESRNLFRAEKSERRRRQMEEVQNRQQ